MSFDSVVPESYSFPATTLDGCVIDLGELVSTVLAVRRNQMKGAEFDTPLNPDKPVAAGFELGAQYAVRVICGQETMEAFRDHCGRLRRRGQPPD